MLRPLPRYTPSANQDRIVWYENLDGMGDFGAENIISTQTDLARSVFAADLDDDGDMDVFSASSVDNKIAWYENLSILSNSKFKSEGWEFNPNPVSDLLYFNKNNSSNLIDVSIYNLQGQLIFQEKNVTEYIELSSLKTGIYLINISDGNSNQLEKLIKL